MVSKVISVSEKLSEYRIGFFKKGVICYRIDMGLGVIGIVSIWVGESSLSYRYHIVASYRIGAYRYATIRNIDNYIDRPINEKRGISIKIPYIHWMKTS